MKRLILPLLFLPLFLHSQVAEHFYDGDFTQDPAWTGDTGRFRVNGMHQLQLNSAGSDTVVLATRCGFYTNQTWTLWAKVSFNTSANNYTRVYLMADTSALEEKVRGYYLQIGGSDDSICIVRQQGSDHHRLQCFRSYRCNKSTNILKFLINKDDAGKWETFIDTLDGNHFVQDCSFTDTLIRDSRYFGFFCRHTSSNSTKIYFDDLYSGPEIRDTVPPAVLSCLPLDSTGIGIRFSEILKLPDASDPGKYFLQNQSAGPEEVTPDPIDPSKLILTFGVPFEEGVGQKLLISGLTDLSGNTMKDTLAEFTYYRPAAYNILISEIMADPEPKVYLPDQEYVELYNNTLFPINLGGWSLSFGSYQKKFPEVIMDPKGFLLLVKDSAAFSKYGTCINLFTSASSLSNEGTTLTIRNKDQQVIHSISYAPEWYDHSFKEDGGWSLEMKDPENPCGCSANWAASTDISGGTPGRANSIAGESPDYSDPVAERAVIEDSSAILVSFSESLDSLTPRRENFILSGEEDIFPCKIKLIPPDYRRMRLLFDSGFEAGRQYAISLKPGIRDCAGNDLDTNSLLRVAIPDPATSSDLLINEILFNPASGGSRFVELFNPTEKVFDLSQLLISDAEILPETGGSGKPITAEKVLIFPGEYVLITPDPDDICSRYACDSPKNFIRMQEFPTLDAQNGMVLVADRGDYSVIDRVGYDHGMHYPLLSSEKGVSLERLSPLRPSGDQENWHSASETSGFATPGRENSQTIRFTEGGSFAETFPEIFSPDNDGRDDVLTITMSTGETDYHATILIFDVSGRRVRSLANNVLISPMELFYWDGTCDSGGRATMGFYLVYLEAVSPEGTIKRAKLPVILGGKL